MNVLKIIGKKLKDKFHSAQNKLALTILIWLEKEPSQERILSAAASADSSGPYIRYREREKLGVRGHRKGRLSEKQNLA